MIPRIEASKQALFLENPYLPEPVEVPSEKVEKELISQYAASPNLREYIGAFAEEVDLLMEAALQTITYRYLDKGFGEQLDVVASLVGAAPRIVFGAAPIGLFGYYDAPSALGFSDATVPDSAGGTLWGLGDEVSGDLILTDTMLKNYIRARIIKNTRKPTVEAMYEYIDLLLGRSEPRIELRETFSQVAPRVRAHFTVYYDHYFTVGERTLLSSVINQFKPAGIRLLLEDKAGVIPTIPVTR